MLQVSKCITEDDEFSLNVGKNRFVALTNEKIRASFSIRVGEIMVVFKSALKYVGRTI